MHILLYLCLCRYSLIPIDHGLIMPHIMDVAEIDLVWFDWPQTKVETRIILIVYPKRFYTHSALLHDH